MLRSPAAIFVAVFALIVVSVGLSARWLASTIEQALTTRLQQELTQMARIVETLVRERGAPGEPGGWDAVADELGAALETRVTLIAEDGAVLGDSAVEAKSLAGVENHGDRPEVSMARSGEVGFSVRYSTTLPMRLAYAALPFAASARTGDAASQPGQARIAVVRLARDASDIEHAARRIELGVAASGVIAILLVAFSIWATQRHRDERVRTLRAAVKHAPDRLRTLFNDDSTDGELARTIDDAHKSARATLSSLEDQVERQRRILEGMQEGVLVLDEDANVAFVNRALREMLLLAQDVTGKPLIEVVRNGELTTLVDRTRADAAPQAGELETAGLKPRRLLVQTSPLEDTPHSLVAVFVDVTDVRRLESLRRDFVANVSHELRTPVTAIKSATETLRTSALERPEDALKFLDIVDRNAQRLADLVEDLLDLSRIESKAYKLTVEPLPLAAVATYCLSLFKERADKKAIVLKQNVPGEIPNVRADRRALEQVLTNLIDNAVKYCSAGTEISIAAEPLAQSVRIIVRDTGPGIEQRHLPRLFERFYRVDAGRARDTGGTGLGLSIAKHLAEAMDGSIGVDSKPGAGTTFYVTLARA